MASVKMSSNLQVGWLSQWSPLWLILPRNI